MKIYSKFKDYYDMALVSFIESEVNYNRETKIISGYNKLPFLGDNVLRWHIKEGRVYSDKPNKLLGVNGKWFIINTEINSVVTMSECMKNYKENALCNFLTDNLTKESLDVVLGKTLFEEFKVPLILIEVEKYPLFGLKNNPDKNGVYTLTLNPNIKELFPEPNKIMDSFTMLYEIESFLNNLAVPDEAIVPVGDDITRLQAYGFDKKTSFRKCKEKP